MLRALVAMLLLANLLFFALSRGALEPWLSLAARNEHEPQRLAAQVNPQELRVLGSVGAAPTATAAAGPASAAASAPY